MPASHDPAYRQFFSHPRMVQDLLQGFVHEDWVADLDFATLERVNAHFGVQPRVAVGGGIHSSLC